MPVKSSNSAKNATSPVIVRPRRAPPVLVCRKCLKRSDEGRDVRRALKSELKADKGSGSKPAKLVMTGCFGLCPKNAVVVASGASLARQEYALVSHHEQVPRALAILNDDERDAYGNWPLATKSGDVLKPGTSSGLISTLPLDTREAVGHPPLRGDGRG